MSLETWLAEYYPTPANEVPEGEALDHSIRKWLGLRAENLSKHKVTLLDTVIFDDDDIEDEPHDELGISINGDTCALCEHHHEYDGSLSILTCPTCPIVVATGEACSGKPGSAYSEFCTDRGPEPMIRLLQLTKDKLANKGVTTNENPPAR